MSWFREIKVLEDNKTWSLIFLLKDKHCTGWKCDFN